MKNYTPFPTKTSEEGNKYDNQAHNGYQANDYKEYLRYLPIGINCSKAKNKNKTVDGMR